MVSLCILASRVLGMVRDVLCAGFFGHSPEWDAFTVAFVIPNLFRRLFGEGALTAAFVPVFVERNAREGPAGAQRLLRALVGVLSVVLLLLVGLGVGLTYLLPELSADPKLRLVCAMLRPMLPYMYFICAAAILGAALNSLKHFFAPAFAPVVFNAVEIGALLLVAPKISVVIGAVLVGGALELLLQIPPLLSRKIVPVPRLDRTEPGLREIWRHFTPMLFGLSLVQINELINNAVALSAVPGDGAVSALYYANRLMQLPLAVIGTALATAAFPRFSELAAANNRIKLAATLTQTLRACLFIAIPASVGLAVLGVPIIRLLFEHGKFGPAETQRTHLLLILYAVGIASYSLNQIIVRAFYARKEVRVPVRISAAMVGVNLVLNLGFVWSFGEPALAASTTLCGVLTSIVLYRILRVHLPELRAGLVGWIVRCMACAAVMGFGCHGAYHELSAWIPGDSILRQSLRLGLAIGLGLGLYFGLAKVARIRMHDPDTSTR